MPLPIPLYISAQVRELDRRAIDVHRITGADLMTRAGTRVFDAVTTRFPRARRVVVVCGPGNNGGDGYVVAALARTARLDTVVLTLGRAPETGDAARMRSQCEALGTAIQVFDPQPLRTADVIVDAALGTGLQRDLAGEWYAAIEAINAAGRPVVAVDVPSGINADTGAVMGVAVRANLTVTFIALKAGLFLSDARDHVGEILFHDLDVPADVYHGIEPVAHRLTAADLAGLVGRRARNSHKGSFGHVLVVGGGVGMPGAARLCAEAALRTGAGLVTVATRPEHVAAISSGRPEVLAFGARGVRALEPLLERASVVALGPGLGQDAWSRSLWRAAIGSGRPLVVDADALNLLASKPSNKSDWVLTPHPGEAARLLGTTTAMVQRDRIAAVGRLRQRYGGACVLKGAGTLIGDGKSTWLCDRGNPGMASGGMGDVLTGVIAALMAQGLGTADAARLGAWLHAGAGDAAAAGGEVGLIASDLYPYLRPQLDRLASGNVDP